MTARCVACADYPGECWIDKRHQWEDPPVNGLRCWLCGMTYEEIQMTLRFVDGRTVVPDCPKWAER